MSLLGGMVGRAFWSKAAGLLAPESRAALQRAWSSVKATELTRLRGDVRGFLAADPVRGLVTARGIVAEALAKHGVNLTELTLELAVRWLASED